MAIDERRSRKRAKMYKMRRDGQQGLRVVLIFGIQIMNSRGCVSF